jgi:prepilin-type N-terminal cleavage/methylation domain-containing protein
LDPNKQTQYSGFSLVELMIVIVIVGLLAAVAVPIYYNSVYDAKKAEAIATMGSIKGQINMYYGEYGWYPIVDKKDYVIGAFWNDIKPGELRGVNFSDSSYLYKSKDGDKWELIVDKKTTFFEKDLKMKSDGTISGGEK